jgi:hypothetical protein
MVQQLHVQIAATYLSLQASVYPVSNKTKKGERQKYRDTFNFQANSEHIEGWHFPGHAVLGCVATRHEADNTRTSNLLSASDQLSSACNRQ